eukprot:CAMPEP_0185575842 /NCGR_PEP_ID=MMETSP0434-20130131/6918_1 /TAXON_ID=626734 ORGANISM="Favella taraikaensis, Strain Fe Narragansett Bay" /NCGR_SAMPLE_ID=MMETSP0434 /ASSEMBLY_ACC=CAM_ASM_000379 /LENGTH=222 /DNA_ID=CAMNT_0028192833 /DNA_START=1614 /DNA_END=2283 /DNA_ORIENTATION=-
MKGAGRRLQGVAQKDCGPGATANAASSSLACSEDAGDTCSSLHSYPCHFRAGAFRLGSPSLAASSQAPCEATSSNINGPPSGDTGPGIGVFWPASATGGSAGEHDFFHLLDRYGTLDVDPLILNHMLHLQLQDKVDAANVAIGHEAETTRLIRPLVLQNDAVLDLAKVSKVAPKVNELEVVREPTDEDFAQLRVNLIATVLGLLPELLYGGELFLVFHNLLV